MRWRLNPQPTPLLPAAPNARKVMYNLPVMDLAAPLVGESGEALRAYMLPAALLRLVSCTPAANACARMCPPNSSAAAALSSSTAHSRCPPCALLTNSRFLFYPPPPPGPAHPYQKDGIAAGLKNHRGGHVEDTHLHPFIFEEQYNTFHAQGTAEAPSGLGPVRHGGGPGSTVDGGNAAKRRKTTAERKADAGSCVCMG